MQMKPYIVAVFNQKGGISKTTTSTNLAVCLAACGKSVVLVDLDSQGDSTKSLNVDPDPGRGIYDVFVGAAELAEVIVPTIFHNLFIVPSTYSLAGIELKLSELKDSQRTLVNVFRKGEIDCDYIVIDCPPALGILPINALAAAHAVIIPVTATPYANDGLMRTLPSIKYVQEGLNKALVLQGVLFTISDRHRTTQRINEAVRARLGPAVYHVEIPRDTAVIEAASAGLPVCVYAPRSPAAAAHLAFAMEFIERHCQAAAKAGIDFDPGVSREQALHVLMEWQERHARTVGRPTGDRIAQGTSRLDRLLYGDRTRMERLHLGLVHFFIDNRLWLVAFLVATVGVFALLLGAGLSGVRKALSFVDLG
ncbi:MAG: AAA family ATPase [Magnetospirillum sp.]|nr:AAA family ATPase [Magnetospirillum sp.]